jgi:hypothetical protein
MTRTWQDNAHEFGALTRQGKDFRLAMLVACSVYYRKGMRRPSDADILQMQNMSKTTAMAFGEAALGSKTATARVLRHLEVWNRMAAAGHVLPADALDPTDAADYLGEVSEEVQAAFAEAFTSMTSERPTGGRPRDSRPEDAVAIIEKRGAEEVVKSMTSQQRAAMANAIESSAHERLRPHPGTPEGKAFQAQMSAQNDATRKIAIPIHEAGTALSQVQRDWEENYMSLTERERREVDRSLGEIIITAEALRLNMALEVES